MLQNGEIKIVVLALYGLGLLLVLLLVIYFAFEQVVGLLLTLSENIRLHPLRFVLGSQHLLIPLTRLFLRCHVHEALNLHIRHHLV